MRLLALVFALFVTAAAAVAPAIAPFQPGIASTVTVAATTTSGSTQVALVGPGAQLTVTNAGTATAFCEQGQSTQTATVATGMPYLAGTVTTINRILAGTVVTTASSGSATHFVCITSAGTATVYVTTGDGS